MEKFPSATAAIKMHTISSKASQVYLTGFLFYFYQIRQHPNIREPLTGPPFHAATKQAIIPPESGGPRTAADGDRQRKREREAERNAERSGGTVVWLDTPAAEPPVR